MICPTKGSNANLYNLALSYLDVAYMRGKKFEVLPQ